MSEQVAVVEAGQSHAHRHEHAEAGLAALSLDHCHAHGHERGQAALQNMFENLQKFFSLSLSLLEGLVGGRLSNVCHEHLCRICEYSHLERQSRARARMPEIMCLESSRHGSRALHARHFFVSRPKSVLQLVRALE